MYASQSYVHTNKYTNGGVSCLDTMSLKVSVVQMISINDKLTLTSIRAIIERNQEIFHFCERLKCISLRELTKLMLNAVG